MLPILSIGPLSLPTQPLLLLFGIWLGAWASEKFASKSEINPQHISTLLVWALVSGLLGARLGYVIQHLNNFAANPLNALALSLQMLDLDSGLLVGLIAGIIYAQKKDLPFWNLLDALTPAFAAFAVFYWAGAFASGDSYGSPTNLPWGISLWGEMRHPFQVYAAVGAAWAAWRSWPRKVDNRVAGIRFLSFTAWTAGYLLVIEAWNGNPGLLFGSIHTVQLVAWLLLAASLYWIGKRQKAG